MISGGCYATVSNMSRLEGFFTLLAFSGLCTCYVFICTDACSHVHVCLCVGVRVCVCVC